MTATTTNLTTAVEAYFAELRRVLASGGATGERSTYPPLAKLIDAVGGALKPKVYCVSEMAEQGAGHPDFGLYAAKQMQKGRRREGQIPECGVVEVKPAGDDAWLTAESSQVSRYWQRYRLVLVTNTRDFVLLGEDAEGRPAKLETFRLAESAGRRPREPRDRMGAETHRKPPRNHLRPRIRRVHCALLASPVRLARVGGLIAVGRRVRLGPRVAHLPGPGGGAPTRLGRRRGGW